MENDDSKCPKCGSDDVSSSLAENAGRNEVQQVSDCGACGVEWRATYKLDRVEILPPQSTEED